MDFVYYLLLNGGGSEGLGVVVVAGPAIFGEWIILLKH